MSRSLRRTADPEKWWYVAEREVPYLITSLRWWRCGMICGSSKRDMIRTMIGWRAENQCNMVVMNLDLAKERIRRACVRAAQFHFEVDVWI